MNNIDELARQLFEQSKRFLEKAADVGDESGQNAYCNAALLTGFSSLEAHVNAMADELSSRQGLGILERSLLLEKEITLKAGKYQLSKALKIYRLEDRITFILANFSSADCPPKEPWWSELAAGTVLRNELVHPKDKVGVSYAAVERSLKAILKCLNYLYQAVFHKAHPSYNRGLDSELVF